MNYKEAIKILDELGGTCSSDPEYVACHMAIEALEEKLVESKFSVGVFVDWGVESRPLDHWLEG